MELEEAPVSTGAVPATLRSSAQLDAPTRQRPQAVQVVSCCPRLIPGAARRHFGAFGESPWSARPLFSAPVAVATSVRRGVAIKDVLRVAPKKPVDDISGLSMVNADQNFPPPLPRQSSWNLRTKR